jgi:hypothetical protein
MIDSGQGFGNRYENEIYVYARSNAYKDLNTVPARTSYGLTGFVKRRFQYGEYGYIDRYVRVKLKHSEEVFSHSNA